MISELLVGGCGKSGSNKGVAPAPLQTASVAEAEKFGKELEAAIRSPQQPRTDFIDWDRLYQHVSTGVPIPHKDRPAAKRGFLDGIQQQGGFVAQIRNEVRNGGHYQFLRVHTVNGKRRALCRMVNSLGGFNYHDYHLVRTKAGKVVAEDIDIFILGEPLSQTMRRIFLQFASQQNRGLIDRMLGRDQVVLKALPQLQQFSTAVRQKQGGTALALYSKLPAEAQNQKYIQLLRIQAAMHPMNEREYLQGLTEFRERFPGDPVVDILSIDYYMLRKDYRACLAAIDRVDKQLGGDGYLDVNRATTYLELNRLDDALTAANRALKAVADYPPVYWTKLIVTLRQRNHPLTLATLKEIDRRFKSQWSEFRNQPGYQEFARSPQHAEWLASQQTKR